MGRYLEYEVKPGKNVPAGLPPLLVAVVSPIWRGSSLTLEYPDGEIYTVVGWSGPGAGSPCDLLVFWTRQQPSGPAVCLAIGGDAGLRDLGPVDGSEPPRGLPFLALAESMIPAEVLEVIGTPPPPQPPLLL
jgi:hypothetical protein